MSVPIAVELKEMPKSDSQSKNHPGYLLFI